MQRHAFTPATALGLVVLVPLLALLLALPLACGSKRSVPPLPPSAPEHLLPPHALVAAGAESAQALEEAFAGSPQGRFFLELPQSRPAALRGAEPRSRAGLRQDPMVRAAIAAGGPSAIALYASGAEEGAGLTTVLAARTEKDPQALLEELLAESLAEASPSRVPAGSRELEGERVFVLNDASGGEILAAPGRKALLLEGLTRGRRHLPEMIRLARGEGSGLAGSRIFAETFADLGQAGGRARFRLFVDLQRAVELADEALRYETSGAGERIASLVWAGLDPRSLQSFAAAVDFSPEGLRASWHLAMTDRVGLTSLFRLPDRPLALPRILPEPGDGAGGLIVTRLNLLALLESLERAASGDTGMGDSFWNNILKAPDRFLGLRVRDDILVRLTDEWALVLLPDATDDAPALPALLGRLVLVAGVTDVAALQMKLDRALRARGLHAARKVRKVEGAELWQVEFLGVRLGIAFGRRLVGLTVGNGIGYLEKVLALEADSNSTRPSPLASRAGEGNPIALASVDLAAVLDLMQQATRSVGGTLAVAPLAARLRELGITRIFERTEQTPSGIRGTVDW